MHAEIHRLRLRFSSRDSLRLQSWLLRVVGGAEWIGRKMSVLRGRCGVLVAEQRADDRKTQPAGRADAGETVPQIVQSDISEPRGGTRTRLCLVNGGARAGSPHARDHPGVVRHARELLKQRTGRSIEIYDLSARLTVGEPKAFVFEIDVIPAQIDNLATTATS